MPPARARFVHLQAFSRQLANHEEGADTAALRPPHYVKIEVS